MNEKDFWYIAAEAKDLISGTPLGIELFGEWIALFRDQYGKPVALADRCLHRCVQLSKGRVEKGHLRCMYHGWLYNHQGHVVDVPSEGAPKASQRRARTFQALERDDYIYIKLSETVDESIQPFRIPSYRQKGWGHIRLKHRFQNNVTNCAENFVDIPHTVFVHPKIFRSIRRERFTAQIRRVQGTVVVSYHNERANLGIFSRFLNPREHEITHTDAFHMPNVTCVDYLFSPRRRFFITSQAIPVTDEQTVVYTDLTYNYGIWNWPARPIIRWQAKTIIRQDIEILGNQMKTIRQFGAQFSNTEADVIHILIESIRHELSKGNDPRLLPDKTHEIEFWV
jgi:phenylpropionate dioxygenase-like ring-hydroxylating dioxygenase large terminal subunit